MIKYNAIFNSCDYTNLKRRLFINKFLNLSVFVWGSWYYPLFLSVLGNFGGTKSLSEWSFVVVILAC